MQFNLVICGLDSVEARRWINATLVGMVDPENEDSLKPLIDGGTEGQWILSEGRRQLLTCITRLQRAIKGDLPYGQIKIKDRELTSCGLAGDGPTTWGNVNQIVIVFDGVHNEG